MKKKVLSISLSICFMLLVSVIGTKAFARTQDNVKIENLVKNYIEYTQKFHQFPSDEINNFTINNASLDKIKTNKVLEVEKYAKKGSDFYNKRVELINNALSKQTNNKEGIRSFGGNAKNINITSINVDGNLAHVSLKFTGCATFGQWQKDHWVKVSPSNDMIDEIDLQKDSSGKWYITNENLKFAPGSEP